MEDANFLKTLVFEGSKIIRPHTPAIIIWMDSLLPELQVRLDALRARRNFCVERWVEAKIELLNAYAKSTGLSAAVVGVSGGIDSAIVLSLAKRASERSDSRLKRVVGICLPYLKLKEGTTNQSDATSRGKAVISSIGAESMVVDLTETLRTLKTAMDKEGGVKGNAWASGQLVSYLRTPALYYATAQLSQEEFPCFVLGTTNRDEGAYIGYFGKAADAMNDVQLISDLHKSEVYQVARYLGNIPQEVIDAAPTGDIHDGRTDEQLIGVPYDFIELHALSLTLAHPSELKRPFKDKKCLTQWETMRDRVEQLHRENKHKYLGGSVALHFDVWPRAIPGGWRPQNEETEPPENPNPSHFVNLVTLDPTALKTIQSNSSGLLVGHLKTETPTCKHLTGMGDSALQVTSLLSKDEAKLLLDFTNAQKWVSAGVDGMRLPHQDADIGSYRLSFYSLALANTLWRRLSPHMDIVRHFDEYSSTDFDDHPLWRAVGVSPLFRAIKYEKGGYLVPHYDSSYSYSSTTKTLMSVVIYLSEPSSDGSGKTRFILDRQRYLPRSERIYKDSLTMPSLREVVLDIPGLVGSALIFDHRIYHDSDELRVPEDKIILRTDIVFEQCGLANTNALTVSKPLGMPTKPNQKVRISRDPVLPPTVEKADDRLYRKHLKDPYYSTVMAITGNFHSVLEGGFFDDGAPTADEVDAWIPQWQVAPLNWFSTPISKIVKRFEIYKQEHAIKSTSPPSPSSPRTPSLPPSSNASPSSSSKTSSKSSSKRSTHVAPSSAIHFAPPTPKSSIPDDKWLAVILTTGSFNPVHNGHLDMMEQGKAAVEANGGFVLGGYISPSHDLYVGMKLQKEAMSAKHRLQLCELATQDSDWMMVDGWEALEVQYPVNFTDVIVHLEQYLAAHIVTHKPIHIVYVFGSDHTRFSLTFVNRGKAVCLNRPGYEEKLKSYQELDFYGLVARNVMFWEVPTISMSSTEARKGEKHGLLPAITMAAYQGIKSQLASRHSDNPNLGTITYHIRDEGIWAYQNMLQIAIAKRTAATPSTSGSQENGAEESNEAARKLEAEFLGAWTQFCVRISNAIAKAHELAESPDTPLNAHISLVKLEDQRKKLEKIRKKALANGFSLLNMDPCLQPFDQNSASHSPTSTQNNIEDVKESPTSSLAAEHTLEVSRVFSLAVGAQAASISHRPGSEPIEVQLSRIPSGKFVLFDDDSFSGFTLQRVAALIRSQRSDVEVAYGVTLTSSAPIALPTAPNTASPSDGSTSPKSPKSTEIIDMRDFLLGAHHGGLVVSLRDGSLARAPYALPYVSPAHRASIPISKETSFSIEVWSANMEFFQSISYPLLVRHLDAPTVALLEEIGFAEDVSCHKIAQWHVKRLQELWKPGGKISKEKDHRPGAR